MDSKSPTEGPGHLPQAPNAKGNKDKKKKEKQARFELKKAQAAVATGPAHPPKDKAKAKVEQVKALPSYVEDTPPGEKKRKFPKNS